MFEGGSMSAIIIRPLVNIATLALGVYAARKVYKAVKAKTIFVSYGYIKNAKYKNTLKMWNGNDKFPFRFEDHSSDISIKSDNEGVIKRAISAKISQAEYFIVLIDNDTKNRNMVLWEIDKAVALKKPIVVVKTEEKTKLPNQLRGYKRKLIVHKFEFLSIKEALNSI